ncbi:PREDICTED: probable inactive serine/threonine-protein kinase scy2 [Drosophila arizonae]|uniref:Probable inactive serine/threonine-protein kinase scy2 n=1 Tax=Drosophila arizonae TaxID=7263 RepID=A0ABM1P0B4_DROAR|nr:PREDICTED: probable inactive serine/threonine-protein kinase scy2 [Drosophila arizonae]
MAILLRLAASAIFIDFYLIHVACLGGRLFFANFPDDISTTAATSTPTSSSTSASASPPIVNDTDKAGLAEQPDVVNRAEINLAKPNKQTTATTLTTPTAATTAPQDIGEQQSAANQINDDAVGQQLPTAATAAGATHNWSPASRRSRTPPAPQNSPVGYGLSAVPPALAPLLQQQQQQHQPPLSSRRSAKNRNSNNNNNSNTNINNNNRIIECDLIPSKKSKRKASKRETETETEHVEAMEATVREQIRDIKPLPGFQQAFGSTEIGRFSERFLQTPESLVERLAEEYAASYSSNISSSSISSNNSNCTNNNSNYGSNMGNSYYDAPIGGNMHGYWPYEEQHGYGYPSPGHHGHSQMPRSRMRGQLYPYYAADYAAYERYGYAAYSAASRARYNEIRCNGY